MSNLLKRIKKITVYLSTLRWKLQTSNCVVSSKTPPGSSISLAKRLQLHTNATGAATNPWIQGFCALDPRWSKPRLSYIVRYTDAKLTSCTYRIYVCSNIHIYPHNQKLLKYTVYMCCCSPLWTCKASPYRNPTLHTTSCIMAPQHQAAKHLFNFRNSMYTSSFVLWQCMQCLLLLPTFRMKMTMDPNLRPSSDPTGDEDDSTCHAYFCICYAGYLDVHKIKLQDINELWWIKSNAHLKSNVNTSCIVMYLSKHPSCVRLTELELFQVSPHMYR